MIYDERIFCRMFLYSLKQRQMIINTFFLKEGFKPMPFKILLMIFSFTCYFVVNGLFYNEEYISQQFKIEGERTIFEYIGDSIQKLLFTSIVGGLISSVIRVLFNSDKQLEEAMEKHKKNNLVLKEKILDIHKRYESNVIIFIISQFIILIFFIFYIFCFCYVYPNNTKDLGISSLLIIGIIQSLTLLGSFLIAFTRYLGLKCDCKICYRINQYLYDNL